MNYYDAMTVIAKRLQTNWLDVTRPVYLSNEFHPGTQDLGTASYALMSFLQGTAVGIGFGSSAQVMDRYPGVLDFRVFTQEGIGIKDGIKFCEDLGAIFQHAKFSGIVCREQSIVPVGPIDDFYMCSLSVPYYWDNTITVQFA